ncbi:S-adenosyl-L-methionine-dependent methyltransferase [Morchella snyderi]|nr:S-adenosyl-L-methionine-dependent methyltransferase [Morchella snyderi]
MEFDKTIKADSDYGESSDDAASSKYSKYSTQSLTTSIYEYRYENGRRYSAMKEGEYTLPNDETEQERLDIIHHIYLLLLDDKLHLAPIDPHPQKILDIGTGTGIWAIDVGERYPSAQVIGTDISPIQPSWVPPNVEFQIDDAELDWTFKKDSFDLVHIRHMGGAIKDWNVLMKQAYRVCKPGGWIDCAEYEMDIFCDDNTLSDSLELKQFYVLVNKAVETTGLGFTMSNKLKPVIERAGFTNVHHEVAKIPVGPWAANRKQKNMGAYVMLSAESGFEAFGIQLFTSVLKMDLKDARHVIQMSLNQARNRHIHGYGMHHLYYGQKPLDE